MKCIKSRTISQGKSKGELTVKTLKTGEKKGVVKSLIGFENYIETSLSLGKADEEKWEDQQG